ncbi:MAG TPA: 4Fe-4S binding protein [Methanomicrobiales archaeon]|nr:4Fe-4S binding protein [Methanomicrobiales archaeon]
MPAVVNPDLCVACETCVDECPAEAIAMEDGIAKVDKKKCTECKTCIDVCPSAAIQME